MKKLFSASRRLSGVPVVRPDNSGLAQPVRMAGKLWTAALAANCRSQWHPAVLAFALLACAGFAAEDFIWVEGEQAARKQIEPNGGLEDVNTDELSGGAWLAGWAHEGKPDNTAEYDVEIPREGKYNFWMRGGGTGLAYRCDGKDWVTIDLKKGVDVQAVGSGGSPHWPMPATWYDLGAREFTAGAHTIAFCLGGSQGKDRYGAIDCFVLTTGQFTPHGKYKPNEKVPDLIAFHPGKVWDFDPPADSFDPAAMLDLCALNETVAGEHGMVRLSKNGNHFVRGDGEPLRFWTVLSMVGGTYDLEKMKKDAKFLAKRGVNLVRIFAELEPKGKDSKITDVDEKQLDGVFMHVAALKAAGIYSLICPFWPAVAKMEPSWGVNPGGSLATGGLIILDPVLQAGYKSWLKTLYTRPNPYTGVKLADEPAVAIIQFVNEDSQLFWGANMSGAALDTFRKQYAEFLKQKHGSLEKTRAAWQDYNPEGHELTIHPDWDKGLPSVMALWDFTRDGMVKKSKWPGFTQCAMDQLEFTAGIMHQFNAAMVDYVRHELGCKQLTNPGNWRTVDPALCQDAEYWSYTAGDVIGRNFYTGGYHGGGVHAGWTIAIGDYYTDVSIIKEPVKLPLNLRQPLGHPFILPEILWVHPNLYQSEGPLMVAAQSSLNGISGCVWSCGGLGGFDKGATYKWSWNTALTMGQFPAAALIYRLGMLKEGAPVVEEHRSLQNIWERKDPLIAEESGWDPNRDTGNLVLTEKIKASVDPLAFLVGPVRVAYDGALDKTIVEDLTPYIDRANKSVRGITGEIELDYGKGLYRVNAPQAQAVSGFLAEAGPQKLADVEITCANAYATIAVVSLDKKPIRKAEKVLIQVGTTSRPTGWSVPTGVRVNGQQTPAFQIVNNGKYPWQIENTEAKVTVANSHLTHAVALDANGVPTGAPLELKQENDKATVVLPPNTLYVVLTAGH